MVLEITGEPKIEIESDGRRRCTVGCKEQQKEYTYNYTYIGEFEEGPDGKPILSGNGKLFSEDGRRKIYEGNLKCGMFDGEGARYYSDGSAYSGGWKDSKEDGFAIYTSPKGFVSKLLHSENFLREQTFMSQEFYEKDGEISDETSGTRRELYTARYDENGNYSTVIYYLYGPTGTTERKLKVNYRKLNELLNEGRLDSIVPGAIEDVTEGLRENERIRTLVEAQEYLRACARQIFRDKMYSGERGLDEGGTRELENLMLLADLGDPKIRVVRFSDQPNEEKMKQRYDNVGALLESLGINPDTIENTTEDFIVTVISTTNGKHAVSAIIDLKKLRELKEQGKNIATTDEQVIFIFDSSRAVGDPKYKECNLGNIQKNCVIVNRRIQKLGSCWYHAVSSTLAATRNPSIFGNLRESARVEQNNQEGQSLWELSGLKDEVLTEFETEQILQLQRTANRYGIGQVDGQTTSKLIVREYVRDGLKRSLADDTLLSTFEERISSLIEKKEKEMGANFSEETRKSLREKHKNKLSEEIRNITPESIRGKYGTRADLEGGRFLRILERIKALHDIESEFSRVLSRIELVRNDIVLLEIRKPLTLESGLGSASGGENGDRTTGSTTVAPLGAISSSSRAEGISNTGDDNKNFRESSTLTEAEELSTASSVLGALSLKGSRELAREQAILDRSTGVLNGRASGEAMGK